MKLRAMPQIVLAQLRKEEATHRELVERLGFSESRVRDSINELLSWGAIQACGVESRAGRGVKGVIYRAALRQPGALPDWIKLEGDATVIHGVRYSNALLEDFGKALPAGQPFLIESREKDGALCVTKLDWAVVDRPGALPDEMTPEMMKAVQLKSELGGYAAANLAGAYDLFSEFWEVALAAAKQAGKEA